MTTPNATPNAPAAEAAEPTAHHGFVLVRAEHVPEVNGEARLYRHAQTGAMLLSIVNDDENKSFGISFRTPPADSTGIAHILEHSVLGGSEKYPLKEPFVQLVKGSLNTYLNAFTSPDRTTYPVASSNLQDFYNLVDVYLDAVFHPLLTPHHLEQEGWHYELADPADPAAPLSFKGVVFNEMKGVYSSPDALLYRASQRALFPDTAYGVDSGGDPRVIPDLTYAQFKRFYTTYYHPSNAMIFFYGDDDPARRLERLDAELRAYPAAPVAAMVALQPPFPTPRTVRGGFGVDPTSDDKKAMVQLNWALPEINDRSLSLALSVLSYCVAGTQAAPLRKALVDSGLGEDLTGGGISGGMRQSLFVVGLKGVLPENIAKVEGLVLDTLATIAAQGIEPDQIEAALNTIEFNLRENNTGSFPRGLATLMRVLRPWTFGQDPVDWLGYETALAAVKHRLAADPGFLSTLIRTYLLDNPHRVTVILEPDPAYNQALEQEEQARLAAAKAAMTPDQIAAVIENTRLLRARQEAQDAPADLARLPMLTLADLERTNRLIPREVSDLGDLGDGVTGGGKLLVHDLFTNGIAYLRVGFDLHSLPQELLPYAEFFGKALLEMGTATEDYVKLSQRIGRKTGGIGYSTYTAPMLTAPEGTAWLFLYGKATMAQVPELLTILREMLLTVKLDDPQRFKQIVLKTKARMEAGLVPAGNAFVGGRLRAAFSAAGWAEEQMDGIDYLFFVRRLADQVERDWPGVLAKLEQVKHLLVDRRRLIADVTLDAANVALLRPQLDELIAALPVGSGERAAWQPGTLPAYEGLTIPAQVNYVGKGTQLYDVGYTYHGSVHVITNFLRTGWLWDQVRAKGGAYGAGVSFSKQSGALIFASYRDPNVLKTLAAYDASANFLRTAELDDAELTKTIIGAIREIDPYQLPDAKGWSSLVRYLVGETDETRQRMREEVLATTAADIRRFADVLDAARPNARVVVMGSGDALAGASQDLTSPLEVTRVL